MAQRTIVQLIDDLTQEPADETVLFALDGARYEIDLSADNAAKMRDVLAVYVANARRASSSPRGRARHAAVDRRPTTQRRSASGRARTDIRSATRAASRRRSSRRTTTNSGWLTVPAADNEPLFAEVLGEEGLDACQASAAAAGSGPTFAMRSSGRSGRGPVSASFRKSARRRIASSDRVPRRAS